VLPLPPGRGLAPGGAPLGLRVAWCEPHGPSALALQALLQHLGCEGQRCDDAASLQAFMALPDAQGRPPWLLVATDASEGQALLDGAAGWLDPAQVIRIGTARDAGAGQRAPAMARPVLRNGLTGRFGAAVALPGVVASGPAIVAGRSGSVLLTEDDPINQAVVRSMLEYAGYRCLVASDGHLALAMLREQPVDLVLMDWQMPGMDGLETTRRLRAGEAGPVAQDLPVVALTANAFAEDRNACIDAGMNDFLTKPVVPEKLFEVLLKWLTRKSA
jgi:two-component system sensor histidine kinase BarA